MSDETAVTSLAKLTSGIVEWTPVEWTKERVDLLKKQVAVTGCTDLEFSFYLEWARKTGLNPFLKQSYLVERKAKRPDGSWESRWEPMASEAGVAARVDALPDFRGIRGAPVFEGDDFVIDHEAQSVVHKTNPAKRGRLLGAWAHAARAGRVVPITYLALEERIQRRGDGKPTQFWERMAPGMLLKCARMEQYRLAYANIFGGAYIAEEMQEDSEPVPTPPSNGRGGIAELSARVASLTAPKEAPPPTPEPAPDSGPVVTFGPFKGREVSACLITDLEASIKLGREQIAKSPGAPWVAKTQECIDLMAREIGDREAALAQPEPGSAG